MFLENNLIKLRALEPDDIDLIYTWENNTEIWKVSGTLIPYSYQKLKNFILNTTNDIFIDKQLRLIIETKQENKTVGCVDLFNFNPLHQRAGIGILINNKNDRQKKYAHNALQLIIDYAFNHLLIHSLYCDIQENNIKSINLFKKNHFIQTGTKKQWEKTSTGWNDMLFFQLIKNT